MALTGTSRGSGATNTAGQSSLVVTPASNLSAGALAVLCVAYDNTGAAGVDSYTSIADSLGNTWTPRQNSLIDPGAASAGQCLRIFTSPQDVATLTTNSTITVSFGAVTVARSWTLMEFTAAAGSKAVYGTGGQETAATATPTITTTSITSGQAVVGCFGREGNDAINTPDGDTTNGAWSANQNAGVGSTTGGSQIISQRKIVTGTATQTYNVTFAASRDGCEAWISVREQSVTVITPPTTATFAPAVTVTSNKTIIPATLVLVIAAFAPTVSVTANQTITPATKSLTIQAFAPSVTVSDNKTVVTPTANLAIETFSPTVTVSDNVTVTPSTLELVLETFDSLVIIEAGVVLSEVTITPETLYLSINTFRPTLTGFTVVGDCCGHAAIGASQMIGR